MATGFDEKHTHRNGIIGSARGLALSAWVTPRGATSLGDLWVKRERSSYPCRSGASSFNNIYLPSQVRLYENAITCTYI